MGNNEGFGPVQLGGLAATVPSNALYRSVALPHFNTVSLNSGAINAVADDAVDVVAFFGDGSGDGLYTSTDATLLSQVAGHSDSGFAAYPVVDPVIVADINGDKSVTSADVTLLNRYLNGTTVVQVPAYPGAPSNMP